ncbi:MAG TPA: quinone oxidoreductase [Geodermatophilus sp.]|nr:quinone oxidoreductase [Geodermatophilus sp.]
MRAVVVTELGGPEVLRVADHETPTPGSREVVVDVAAAGVNFMDIYGREGRPPYTRDTPFVLGAEGAGVVSAVGGEVGEFAVGDPVAWTGVPGSYAEQVVVPADRAVQVPSGVDVTTAAAVMLQGCTAHYLASSTWRVSDDDVAVVHAAAGGVGQLLTQIVRLRGGVVVATTSGGEKADLARGAGAQHVAGYDDYLEVVREVTGGDGADVVYDGVGKATFDDSLRALRRRGLMVLYGAASGPVPPFDPQRLMTGSLYVTRPTLGDYIATRDELVARTEELFGWIADGRLKVRIGGTYRFSDAARAHEDLAGRRTTGKLLLTP